MTSEQWLIRDLGAYLPGVCEVVRNQSSLVFCDQISNLFCKQSMTKYMTSILLQVLGVESAHTLTETTALHMRAKQTCTDVLGKKR